MQRYYWVRYQDNVWQRNCLNMFDVFGSVKGLIKLESICIDNNVFRLHYKATFIILVVASLLVTSRQYIGDPIDCIVEEIPNNVSSNLILFFWNCYFPNGKIRLKSRVVMFSIPFVIWHSGRIVLAAEVLLEIRVTLLFRHYTIHS